MVEKQDPDQLSLFSDAGNMRMGINRISSVGSQNLVTLNFTKTTFCQCVNTKRMAHILSNSRSSRLFRTPLTLSLSYPKLCSLWIPLPIRQYPKRCLCLHIVVYMRVVSRIIVKGQNPITLICFIMQELTFPRFISSNSRQYYIMLPSIPQNNADLITSRDKPPIWTQTCYLV